MSKRCASGKWNSFQTGGMPITAIGNHKIRTSKAWWYNYSRMFTALLAHFPAWAIYAVLSAIFASLVAIFGKIGIRDVDSNLAVAIRTVIIVFFAWGVVFIQGSFSEIWKISKFSMTFIILSALATGLSWMFYYRALQLGDASSVVPIDKLSIALTIILAFIILGEKPTYSNVFGGLLVTAGVMVTIFGNNIYAYLERFFS